MKVGLQTTRPGMVTLMIIGKKPTLIIRTNVDWLNVDWSQGRKSWTQRRLS